jgi:hypothetical protein
MLEALISAFETIEDPRCEWKVEHRLLDILVIAVCAALGEAESFEGIALYGRCKRTASPRTTPPDQVGGQALPAGADAGRPGRVRALVPGLGADGVPARGGRAAAGGDRRQDRPALVRPPQGTLAPAPGQRLRDRGRDRAGPARDRDQGRGAGGPARPAGRAGPRGLPGEPGRARLPAGDRRAGRGPRRRLPAGPQRQPHEGARGGR